MRATKAYIASFGTTGVLLGASILMLAVVSAVVAFDGWPSGTVSTRVHTLVLADTPAPIRVSATAPVGRNAAARALAAARASGPRLTNVPRVAGRHFGGGRLGAPLTAPAGPQGGAPGPALPPVHIPTDSPIDIGDAPNSVRSQLADQTQAATNSAGVSAGKISPEIGQAVTDAGSTAADALRKLPLPRP